MSFNEDGFLSDLSQWTLSAHEKHRSFFQLAKNLNRKCTQILLSNSVPPTDKKQLLASVIFARALQSFQGTILMGERGMISEARTLVRTCAESAIALASSVVDAEFIDKLIGGDFRHRKTIATKLVAIMQKHGSSVESLQHLEKFLADCSDDDPCWNMKWEQMAISAEYSSLYDTIYRATSADALHVTITSLNRHIVSDSNDEIVGFTFGPTDQDLSDTLSSAISSILYALHAFGRAFQYKNEEGNIVDHHDISETVATFTKALREN